ncbi:MAG: crotonase/enoyl-CoA hydratase family protein [Alphaproteobacteria bacterium]|nr:crotonase/enoyl-CoA hydratase family protein [Alphaproteobacteria bacterium]
MAYECFDVAIADHVATITLKRPDAFNTMTRGFWNELPEIVRDIDHNAKARVIVIQSTGKHFCAGMDLAVFTGGPEANPSAAARAEGDRWIAAESLRHQVRLLQDSFSCIDEARIPVLAAIQGGCIGGAVDMTSACDIRYCTADAFFCVQEINLAMTADVGTFPRLCKLIPEGWVRELAYTGRRLPAHKAQAIGLVNDVYPDQETMLQAVHETAREIASKNPLAITGSKVMINYARDHSVRDGLDYIAVWQTGMFAPPHMAESFAAKQEKRDAVYPDLLPLRKSM